MSEKNEWRDQVMEIITGVWDREIRIDHATDEVMELLRPAPSAPGDAQDDAKDAARWRFIRRKLCLTGNGDGTCGMHAINLPASIPGWPDPGAAVAEFCDAAVDAAIAAQQGEGGAA